MQMAKVTAFKFFVNEHASVRVGLGWGQERVAMGSRIKVESGEGWGEMWRLAYLATHFYFEQSQFPKQPGFQKI